MAEFDARTASGDECGAVREVVDVTEIAAEDDSAVVEEAGAIGFFDSLEFVEQTGEQFAVSDVTFLGGFHALAGL